MSNIDYYLSLQKEKSVTQKRKTKTGNKEAKSSHEQNKMYKAISKIFWFLSSFRSEAVHQSRTEKQDIFHPLHD